MVTTLKTRLFAGRPLGTGKHRIGAIMSCTIGDVALLRFFNHVKIAGVSRIRQICQNLAVGVGFVPTGKLQRLQTNAGKRFRRKPFL